MPTKEFYQTYFLVENVHMFLKERNLLNSVQEMELCHKWSIGKSNIKSEFESVFTKSTCKKNAKRHNQFRQQTDFFPWYWYEWKVNCKLHLYEIIEVMFDFVRINEIDLPIAFLNMYNLFTSLNILNVF